MKWFQYSLEVSKAKAEEVAANVAIINTKIRMKNPQDKIYMNRYSSALTILL